MMNNLAYLRHLQDSVYSGKQSTERNRSEIEKAIKAAPFEGMDFETAKAHICSLLSLTEAELYELHPAVLKDRLSWHPIIEPFLESLPTTISEPLKRVAFGSLPTQSHIVETYMAPDGNPVVVFQDGMIFILNHYVWIRHFREEHSHQDWARRYYLFELTKIFELYLKGACVSGNLIRGELSYDALLRCTAETQLCKLFVACHELAHVHLDHLTVSHQTTLRMVEGAGAVCIQCDEYGKEQEMEFEADATGFGWYLDYIESERGFPTEARRLLAGAYRYQPFLALYIFNWLEVTASPLRRGDAQKDTHPHTVERIQKLASAYWGRFTDQEKRRIDELMDAARSQVEKVRDLLERHRACRE